MFFRRPFLRDCRRCFPVRGSKPFIDLVWAPVTDVDLDGYNVYRHEEGATPVKVNAELVKTPAYRDANVGSGKSYFYSVSAVDVRGNESARSEEAERDRAVGRSQLARPQISSFTLRAHRKLRWVLCSASIPALNFLLTSES